VEFSASLRANNGKFTTPTLPPSTFSNDFSSSRIRAVIVSLSSPAPEAYVRDWSSDNVTAGRGAANERVERDRRGAEAGARTARAAVRSATLNMMVVCER
jgi:hypothetical protein